MNRHLKIILGIFILVLLLLALSPFVSLILPEKLTNHTYYRLLYHIIVDRETADCQNNEEKTLRLFQYVIDHEFVQGRPYKCKPAESLIYAEAYCDFQARTLNALLGIAGIPSRYAMLLDRKNNDISPHTLNEVFLDKKWCIFDTSTNIIFKDEKANMVSLEQISGNPSLIYDNKKLIALKIYNKAQYQKIVKWMFRMFPITAEPKRSTPRILQYHIFDYITDIYFKIFKYNFFNLYQNLYFKFKKENLSPADFKLFYIARNYHLAYRKDLALRYYNTLLEKYSQSDYIEDAIFFCGVLYFDMRNFPKSIVFFNLILEKYSPKWRNASFYYLGKAYNLMGDKEASLTAYSNVDTSKLTTQILEDLIKHGFIKMSNLP